MVVLLMKEQKLHSDDSSWLNNIPEIERAVLKDELEFSIVCIPPLMPMATSVPVEDIWGHFKTLVIINLMEHPDSALTSQNCPPSPQYVEGAVQKLPQVIEITDEPPLNLIAPPDLDEQLIKIQRSITVFPLESAKIAPPFPISKLSPLKRQRLIKLFPALISNLSLPFS